MDSRIIIYCQFKQKQSPFRKPFLAQPVAYDILFYDGTFIHISLYARDLSIHGVEVYIKNLYGLPLDILPIIFGEQAKSEVSIVVLVGPKDNQFPNYHKFQ